MWKCLLVPIDFSECARHALELALAIGLREGASLTLLHVTPLPPSLSADAIITAPGTTTPLRIDEYTTRGVRARLESIAAPLRVRGVDVRTLAIAVSSSGVAEEILRAAEEVDADAIVVGTHGRTGLAHLLLGSVAEKVIRGAKVPVITIRVQAAEAQQTPEERVAEDELTG